MVYLDRIYTRSGDAGETSLGDGTRVRKTHPRISSYGTVDELNAVLGVALASGEFSEVDRERLLTIQNDLFDVGADLCVPQTDEPLEYTPLRVQTEQVDKLEQWIDSNTEKLTPLKSFILPGGSLTSALLHQARTVCRRAEIEVQHLIDSPDTLAINENILIYLNRLSDLLFVMARMANDQGAKDVLWKPGGKDA